MSDAGEGIGKLDGFTWFIKDAVIGDLALAKVTKVKKSYGFAKLVKVLEPSENRVIERCAVARQCGGCQLQALSYEAQLRFKENKILNNLRRIAGLNMIVLAEPECGDPEWGKDSGKALYYPIIGMDEPWRYRNKSQFPVGEGRDGQVIMGYYAGRSHTIIEHEDCLLGVEENKAVLQYVKRYMEHAGVKPYNEVNHQGTLRHALIRKGFKTGELMVCLVVNGGKKQLPGLNGLVDDLVQIAGMRSVSININRERTNVILGKEIVNLFGPGYITDYIGEVQYRISPLSFYQINPIQTEKLYQTALDFAGLSGDEVVWDLYCGIGTISLFLARKAKMVYGVEAVPEAIEDARRNAERNGLENVEFFVGKAEEVLPEQFEKNRICADVIVVDPPRRGCDRVCLETIVKMRPERVVYVSCDPGTLARDLGYLMERGYLAEKVRGVDMFPQGGHVETVVKLERKA